MYLTIVCKLVPEKNKTCNKEFNNIVLYIYCNTLLNENVFTDKHVIICTIQKSQKVTSNAALHCLYPETAGAPPDQPPAAHPAGSLSLETS